MTGMDETLRAPAPSRYIVSMPETYSQEAVVDGLPPAQELIDAAREAAMTAVPDLPDDPGKAAAAREKRLQAASRALNPWAPAIDQMTDISGAAIFLGRKSDHSIRRKRFRERADGTPEWPGADKVFGRSPAWKYRTIIAHLAVAPGRGHPGFTGRRDWVRARDRNENVMPVADGYTLPPGAADALQGR